MNLGQIRADTRIGVGNVTTTDVPDSALNACINKAYRYIATVYPNLPSRVISTITTVVGIQNYNLPADCFAVRKLWDITNNTWLTKRGERWGAQQQVANASQGKPTDYIRYLNYVQLWPIPDGIYTIDLYYQSSIADLVSDADVPVIPIPWHEGLIIKSCFVYYSWYRKDYVKAQAEDVTWKMWLSEMPTSIDLENVDIDSGVDIPTLNPNTLNPRLDFDHAP
jgi:hypothetical protein